LSRLEQRGPHPPPSNIPESAPAAAPVCIPINVPTLASEDESFAPCPIVHQTHLRISKFKINKEIILTVSICVVVLHDQA